MGGFTKPTGSAPAKTTLNKTYEIDKLPQWVKDAFAGHIERVELPDRTRLYKISSHYLQVPDPDGEPSGKATPWWKPRDEFKLDLGLDSFLHLASHLRTSPGDLNRVTSAVRRPWNNLTHIITAQLTKPVFAFFGRVGWQPRNGNLPLAEIRRLDGTGLSRRFRAGYPGGGYQFYIPGMLAFVHIMEVQRVRIRDIFDAKGQVRLRP